MPWTLEILNGKTRPLAAFPSVPLQIPAELVNRLDSRMRFGGIGPIWAIFHGLVSSHEDRGTTPAPGRADER
jgi:hypothetical protein